MQGLLPDILHARSHALCHCIVTRDALVRAHIYIDLVLACHANEVDFVVALTGGGQAHRVTHSTAAAIVDIFGSSLSVISRSLRPGEGRR